MKPVSDRDLLRDLRDAESSLQERPSARVRRDVLQAAAQAAAERTAAAARPARRAPQRHWPLPLAASILVGAIGLTVYNEVQRETAPAILLPAPSPPPEAARRDAAPSSFPASAAPTAPSSAAPAAAEAAPADARAAATVAPQKASERQFSAPVPGAAAGNAAAAAAGAAPVAAPAAAPPATPALAPAPAAIQAAPPAPAAQAPMIPPPPPPAAFQAPVRSLAEPAQSAPAALEKKEGARMRDAVSDLPSAAVPAPAPAPSSAAAPAAKMLAPEAWAERIVELRKAGRDDDADRELADLRKRYPEFEVPAAALRAQP